MPPARRFPVSTHSASRRLNIGILLWGSRIRFRELRCASSMRPRGGPPKSPRMRDRWPCRISYHRTCNRTHGPQNHRSRHRAQGSISSTILSSCFGRNKRPCDQRGDKQFFHRGLPEFIAGHGTSEMRRHQDACRARIHFMIKPRRQFDSERVRQLRASGSPCPIPPFQCRASNIVSEQERRAEVQMYCSPAKDFSAAAILPLHIFNAAKRNIIVKEQDIARPPKRSIALVPTGGLEASGHRQP